MVTEELQDEQSAQLLAQANLHRMRKQWDDAMTCCMQVLYHSPDNWRAHGLLGDIYADMDRAEDAIQWYCMALDIRPESATVREKLSALVNSRRHQIVDAIDPAHPITLTGIAASYDNNLPRWITHWRSPAGRYLLWIGCIALIVILAFVVLPNLITPKPNAPSSTVFTAGAEPTNTGVVLQTVTPGASQSTPAAAIPTPTAPAPSSTTTIGLMDTTDQALTSGLQADTGLSSSGIQISIAQLDPSTANAAITCLCAGASNSPPIPTRVMADALAVARAALSRPECASAQSATVRCLIMQTLPNTQPGATLSFIGTATRAGLAEYAQPLTGSESSADLQARFASAWWAPGMRTGS